jgi:acyl-CoA thioesterase-1
MKPADWSAAAVLVGIALACTSDSPTRPAADRPAATPVVVALGDSLTAGPGIRPGETYPARLQERIRAAGLPHTVLNAGVSGDTTAEALARLDRALVSGAEVLIVALGANDGLRGVPVVTVERNLETIIERTQARGIRVLLCGMETPPTHGWEYTLAFHRIFPDLARRHQLPLLPFLLSGVVGRPEMNLEDGWHPNAAGAQRIAENIWPYLEQML